MSGSGRNRLLKILHIDPERDWGGGEAQVVGLLSYLAACGHHNELLGHPQGLLWSRCQPLGVTTRTLKIRNDLDLRCIPGLRRLIRQERYDIVHLHTKRAHALSFWLPRYRGGPKYLVTRRMDYPEARNFYTRTLYNRRVDGVVAISKAIKDSLLESGVDGQRMRVIYSGIDTGKYDGLPPRNRGSGDPLVIGSLAALEARKGQCFLIDAVSLLKAQGLRAEIRFAGAGPERADLEQQAGRLGLSEQISFFGFVAEPATFLTQVDVVAMPSLHEGLGVAALEAMAAAKPVVASRVGGLSESILDGVTGYLIPPRDARALAEAIAKFIHHPSLAAAMGQRGRERVLQNFSVIRMAQQNEMFYYDLLDTAN